MTAPPSPVDPTHPGDPATPRDLVDSATLDGRPIAPGQLRDRGRYQVLGEHGRGGLGRVARAHDLELRRDVAIKELLSRDDIREARFVREAMITARLEHPGIVPVHEAGHWSDGTPFYAMKLVSGRPLRDLIAERTTVDQRIALLHHVIAVADAIAYAHARNIIHRDLKPANIIVGDYGETVVIDWGLAKDLNVSDDLPASSDGSASVLHDSVLTAAGSVLGTPSYMAPEQARGEHVDQRADVFAIGAMLWELCSIQRVPPTDLRQRHHMLRRVGIDPDLITIIDKALAPDPIHRYPDAGALVADLKAFKSGARIAARNYSPFALLAHWTRRHRALAIGALVAAAVSVGGALLYVHKVNSEREQVEAANNNLVLAHSDLLLHADPTAAYDLLKTYHGIRTPRWAMLMAKAQGLGVSHLRARPHGSSVLFAKPVEGGAIVTLGFDGAVVKTGINGSRTIARGGVAQSTFAFSDSRQLLAYACIDTSICLIDVRSEREIPFRVSTRPPLPIALAFSPDGNSLAAISTHGEVSLWDVREAISPILGREFRLENGSSLRFVDNVTVVARTAAGVYLFHLDAVGASGQHPSLLPVASGHDMTSDERLQLVAVGANDGTVAIIDSRHDKVLQRAPVCTGSVNGVAILAADRAIAYACQDGDAGTWSLERQEARVLAHMEGGAAIIAASTEGHSLMVGSNNGQLICLDLRTHLVASRRGHATQITVLVPPSHGYPNIITGDTTGNIRTWMPPDHDVHVIAKMTGRMYKPAVLATGLVLAIGAADTIPWYQYGGASGELHGHHPDNFVVAASSSTVLSHFVMYGLDDEIELWQLNRSFKPHIVKTNHGSVNAVVYTSNTQFVVGSDDGKLTEWLDDGTSPRILGNIHESIEFLRVLPDSNALIVGSVQNKLWIVDGTEARFLGKEEGAIVSAVTAHSAALLAVGTSQGLVRLYNIRDRGVSTVLSGVGRIEHLAFSFDGTQLAVASEDKIFVVRTSDSIPAVNVASQSRWTEIELSVRYLSFSPDNKWLAATCDDGAIWFYDRQDDRWFYTSIGSAKISSGGFSADSKYLAVSDTSGQSLLVGVPR